MPSEYEDSFGRNCRRVAVDFGRPSCGLSPEPTEPTEQLPDVDMLRRKEEEHDKGEQSARVNLDAGYRNQDRERRS